MAGRRFTAAQKARRIEKVAEWVCQAKPRREIIDLAADEWGISIPQVDRDLREARELVAAQEVGDRRFQRNLVVTRLESIFHAAVDEGDLSVALRATKELARILGLDRHFDVADLEKLLKLEAVMTDGPAREAAGEAPPADGVSDEVRSDPRGVVMRLAGGRSGA